MASDGETRGGRWGGRPLEEGANPAAPWLLGLNEEQRAAVEHSGSHLLVHAGAGSGKTRVVIARILQHILIQGIAPWNILAVTFTNRATQEMRERLAASLDSAQSEAVLIRTFHSFGAWFLRRFASEAGLASSFTIYDEEDSQALLRQAWPGCDAKLLQRLISRAKESGQEESSRPDFATAFQRYQEALARSGNADFADLLALPVRVLEQHPPIRQKMQQRFRRILVDEYQDSNPLQNRLLHLLLGGAGQELCIVGDEDQSIYGFRGAEIRHILEFQRDFAPAKILKLEQNYRSCAPILELANQLIAHNRDRLGKKLRPVKLGGRLPEFHFFDTCEEEAVFVAQRSRENPEQRTAILYRTNAQSRTFERVLREWNIPYRLVGHLSFYRREEIKDVVAFLKCLANPQDLVSFERIYNKPRRGLGLRTLERIQAAMAEGGVAQAMRKVLASQTLRSHNALAAFEQQYSQLQALLDAALLVELIQEVLQRSGLLAHYEAEPERCQNLESLLEEAQHYGRGLPALLAFLESIELETGTPETPEEEPPQTLITMHNTKGLEFERVFITGLELGLFPNFEALHQPQKMEEERRLFYVAITRAKKVLYLSAVKLRRIYGREQTREISPLLRDLDPAFYQDCRLGPEPAAWKPLSAQQRRGAETSDPFVVGARVEHLDYGLGYVVQRKRSGEITTLMVKLDDGRLIRVQLGFQSDKLEFLGV